MRAGGQGGWIQLLALIGGSLAPWLLTSPPPAWLSAALLVAGSALLLPARLRWAALFLLGCGLSLWQLQWRLADRLDAALAVTVHSVAGVIASLPDEQDEYARFLFAPGAAARASGLPSRLLVYWYRDWPELRAGQSWRLELLLKPPWGAVNFQGPDRERWLFSQGIGGLATVRSGGTHNKIAGAPRPLRFALHRLREDIRRRIVARLGEGRESGVIRALAIADRAGMRQADRQLMMATGTSHLLAISGLHIGLAAIGGFWLVRALLWLLPFGSVGARNFWLCLGGALLLAGMYACLAGLGVATRRAMLMLLIGMVALALARSIHPARALALSAAAILLLDPFAALTAGFWFSFLAVAALLWMFVPRCGRMPWWKSLLMAQLAVVVVMMPVSLFWFEAFALTGFLVNLVAIPWVSLVLVPLTLFAMLAMPISAELAGVALDAAADAAAVMLSFLEWMDGLHGLIGGVPAPTAWQLLGGVCAGLLLILPRTLGLRWLGLFLLLPMFLPPGVSTAPGSLLLEVLDVGQGTAVTVSTSRHTLLYDSGPGDGRAWHRVDSVLRPALIRRAGRAPQRIVISHGDLDHAGGLGALLQRYPQALFNANLRDSKLPGCALPLRWQWEGARFDVLHPSPALPYLGNDSSCVLSVRLGQASILLSGDISRPVEDRLLADGLGSYRVLLVPHHGSASSSGPAFIERVAPQAAIGTDSLGNRFGFPRPEVRDRYLRFGVAYWSSGECGALRLVLQADGRFSAISARRQRSRLWRWPAADGCP